MDENSTMDGTTATTHCLTPDSLFFLSIVEQFNANIHSTLVAIQTIRQMFLSKSIHSPCHDRFYDVLEYLKDLEQDLLHITRNFLQKLVCKWWCPPTSCAAEPLNTSDRWQCDDESSSRSFLSDLNLGAIWLPATPLREDHDDGEQQQPTSGQGEQQLEENAANNNTLFSYSSLVTQQNRSRDAVMAKLLQCQASCRSLWGEHERLILAGRQSGTSEEHLFITKVLNHLSIWFYQIHAFHAKLFYHIFDEEQHNEQKSTKALEKGNNK